MASSAKDVLHNWRAPGPHTMRHRGLSATAPMHHKFECRAEGCLATMITACPIEYQLGSPYVGEEEARCNLPHPRKEVRA
jgi:hypothetical protein